MLVKRPRILLLNYTTETITLEKGIYCSTLQVENDRKLTKSCPS